MSGIRDDSGTSPYLDINPSALLIGSNAQNVPYTNVFQSLNPPTKSFSHSLVCRSESICPQYRVPISCAAHHNNMYDEGTAGVYIKIIMFIGGIQFPVCHRVVRSVRSAFHGWWCACVIMHARSDGRVGVRGSDETSELHSEGRTLLVGRGRVRYGAGK